MTKLVIGKDAIDVKAVKRKVLSNLRLLNSRLQGLCRSSTSFDMLHAFYSQKVEEQLAILEWFEKFDSANTSANPTMQNAGIARLVSSNYFAMPAANTVSLSTKARTILKKS